MPRLPLEVRFVDLVRGFFAGWTLAAPWRMSENKGNENRMFDHTSAHDWKFEDEDECDDRDVRSRP